MGDERVRSFEDLECWKACRRLRLFIAKQVVPVLPSEEKFRLVDQLLRAARSTTANVAEGYGRYHHLENVKFCSNARGSCYETLDHLITACDEGLITSEMGAEARRITNEAVKLINGYIRYLRSSATAKT